MDQNKTPLFSALKRHWESSPLSGHVPGHKYGDVFPGEANGYFNDILKLDATEITGLDDLHDPEGIIEDAQRLAADLYGADETFFLVNGSTVGNLAMIMATCTRGSKVLVQRNCHKSILNGLELAGAEPVFISCEVDENLGVAVSIKSTQLKEALETVDGIEAVILTNPNYYGVATQLDSLIGIIHTYNVPVLVDEAHGAHFILGEPFPKTALASGADIVVHSAHKTLPAMTMASFLHVQGDRVKKDRISHYLKILLSSSPSYPLMASLDLARYYLASIQDQEVKNVYDDITTIHQELEKIEGVEVVVPQCGLQIDPLKLTLRSTTGLTGFALQQLLEKEGLFVELADHQNVLIVLPLAVNEKKHDMIERIDRALLGQTKDGKEKGKLPIPPFPVEISRLAIPFSEQHDYKVVRCNLEDAVGEVAARPVIPYPPGIPLLFKGERITRSTLEYIEVLVNHGARFQGSEWLKSNYMFIYKKEKE
ncbi:arginine decarboxylase [Bacillus sp. LL01]|uniref:aminotransferase class I/II-fold pyridoxal phosphate-dependent enzyme n=1 Tax=Bacillus sp. LL01 TaxID=1665556 RepID=UPI00064D2AA9|nr:aminotransferase class I/II-fold pyridoxal phosphate-dependent enzyme [Bacillus sp. LL01]KMJ56754.1 arginine decarboxylase [Bacillus sp. LL01]